MKEIKINVADKVASAIGSPVIVCGNSNYKITFIFDSEWGAYQEKTARFTFRRDGIDKYIDVLFSGNSCTAPILTNIERVSIGVYAGDLRTTTGAEIRCKKSILCRGGLKHEQPPEDVYNQILETVSKKLGSEGGTVTGDYFKDGNTFIHEGNLELVEPKINEEINEVLANEKVVETASGSAITIESANAPIPYLKLSGKTTQDGTPTPTEPKELKSVGDSGSFSVDVYGGNVFDGVWEQGNSSDASATTRLRQKNLIPIYKGQKVKVQINDKTNTWQIALNCSATSTSYPFTKYGECGVGLLYSFDDQRIKSFTVTENGVLSVLLRKSNNTDITPTDATDIDLQILISDHYLTMPYTLRSVGEVKDEVDFARGVRTPRLIAKVLTGEEGANLVGTSSQRANLFGSPAFTDILAPEKDNTTIQVISSHFGELKTWQGISTSSDFNSFALHPNGTIGFAYNGTRDEANAWLKAQNQAGTPVTFICLVKSAQETPLTETELNAYRQLTTNSGNTTILSEADMEVDYYTPKGQAIGNLHTQINKDYFKLTQAIISTGGN